MTSVDFSEARKDFRYRLNVLFIEQECSVVSFAKKTGITRQAMTNYLTGTNVPDIKRLISIANACNVTTDWLLGLSDVRNVDIMTERANEQTEMRETLFKMFLTYYHDEITKALGSIRTDLEAIIRTSTD